MDTAALDFRKLAKLKRSHAAYVGDLLVGFDSEEAPMDADVGEFVHQAGIGLLPWTTIATGWPDPNRQGCRVRCWFWYRHVAPNQ
jgi:hypothetical protein